MKSPSPPPAPDPVATANAQGAANRETALAQAELNMVNQTDAFGNKLVYNPIGTSGAGNPRYEAITTLSPQQQALADQQQQIYGTALNTAGSQLDAVKAALGQAAPTFDENYRKQQLAAILSRQQPQLDRDRAALETQLANQGIALGSEAYNTAMQQYNQRLNDLNLAADTQAGNEARSALQAAYAGRAQPLNELSALMSLGQVQTPQFQNTPQTGIQAPDVIGATQMGYQGQLNNYNQAMQSRNSMFGGLAGLGGAALGGWAQAGFPALAFSDERLKTDIEQIGTTEVTTEIPVYEYRYKWDDPGTRRRGVMAQELEKVKPEAVAEHPSGYKMVDYAQVQ